MRSKAVVLLLALLLALQAAPGSATLYQKSYELELANDPVQALATLERVPAAEQNRYIYRLRRGWLLYLGARHAEAVSSYEQAIALAPNAIEPGSS